MKHGFITSFAHTYKDQITQVHIKLGVDSNKTDVGTPSNPRPL